MKRNIIKELRSNRGWSQEHLATITELNVRTIQRIENGELASSETRQAIASAFNTDVWRIFPIQCKFSIPYLEQTIFSSSDLLAKIKAGSGFRDSNNANFAEKIIRNFIRLNPISDDSSEEMYLQMYRSGKDLMQLIWGTHLLHLSGEQNSEVASQELIDIIFSYIKDYADIQSEISFSNLREAEDEISSLLYKLFQRGIVIFAGTEKGALNLSNGDKMLVKTAYVIATSCNEEAVIPWNENIVFLRVYHPKNSSVVLS